MGAGGRGEERGERGAKRGEKREGRGERREERGEQRTMFIYIGRCGMRAASMVHAGIMIFDQRVG